MKPFALLALSLAAFAAPAFGATDIGTIKLHGDSRTIPVRVWGSTAALNGLANEAFSAHGRYSVVSSGYAYDIRFTQVGAAEVRVDVTRGVGGGRVLSQTVSGDSARNALLRAGDLAVERTNGLGLKGFFTARIAFISERTGHPEVYTSDLFFGGIRQITTDRAIALEPRWSPDGTKIIYTSYYHSGFPDIFLMDLASDTRTTFASYRGTNFGAHFSPDGGRVAMVLSADGNSEIYVSNAQGRAMSRKTRFESVKASPCWSPDGSRIVFESGQGANPQLYLMSAAGGTPTRLTHGLSSYCAEPDWSRANPNKIAFTYRAGDGHYQIAVYDFAKGQAEGVSKAPFDGLNPSWLPDGRHLVYAARSAATSVLCILDTETGQSQRISPPSFGSCKEANVWSR
ncbi:MAG TPA: biopolymer transporter Tol [Opitutaceae bacterium]|nr:biopolymer transporter Tol [Opitutaceae bacterium]